MQVIMTSVVFICCDVHLKNILSSCDLAPNNIAKKYTYVETAEALITQESWFGTNCCHVEFEPYPFIVS